LVAAHSSYVCTYVPVLFLQVALFGEENTNIPKFLIQSQKAFQLHFTQSRCDHGLVNELYKVEDVYSQITHIVNAVSMSIIL